MTRAEIEAKLIELERDIQKAKTAIWLAERQRLQLRFELRRLINKETTDMNPTIPPVSA
jgi:hypothetical protein